MSVKEEYQPFLVENVVEAISNEFDTQVVPVRVKTDLWRVDWNCIGADAGAFTVNVQTNDGKFVKRLINNRPFFLSHVVFHEAGTFLFKVNAPPETDYQLVVVELEY